MSIQSSKHILCTWEIGGDLGHLTRLANITRKLEQRNHRVTVAVKDLSRAAPVFAGTSAQLVQAPVWLPKISLNRPIACMADSLLLLGYLEPDGLQGLVQAWRNLVELVQPDLCLLDYSPTALLACRTITIPKITVGTGFYDPVPGQPLADWRPQTYQDNLIARQETRLLETINSVLEREQQPPLPRYSDLYAVDAAVINAFPALDIYGDLRQNGHYFPCDTNTAVREPVVFPAGSGPCLVAYLKPHFPHLNLLLEALARCDARVFVACPGGQDATLKVHACAKLAYSTRIVALEQAIADADLFVGHGNMGSVTQALLAGTPQLGIPVHLEQLLTLSRVQALGAGLLVDRIESASHLQGRINLALRSTDLRDKARAFQAAHAHLVQPDLATAVADLCDQHLHAHSNC